jgi:hypothetical protein
MKSQDKKKEVAKQARKSAAKQKDQLKDAGAEAKAKAPLDELDSDVRELVEVVRRQPLPKKGK